ADSNQRRAGSCDVRGDGISQDAEERNDERSARRRYGKTFREGREKEYELEPVERAIDDAKNARFCGKAWIRFLLQSVRKCLGIETLGRSEGHGRNFAFGRVFDQRERVVQERRKMRADAKGRLGKILFAAAMLMPVVGAGCTARVRYYDN